MYVAELWLLARVINWKFYYIQQIIKKCNKYKGKQVHLISNITLKLMNSFFVVESVERGEKKMLWIA